MILLMTFVMVLEIEDFGSFSPSRLQLDQQRTIERCGCVFFVCFLVLTCYVDWAKGKRAMELTSYEAKRQ